MAILNKTDLFHSLFDAFRQNTDSVYFVCGNNPYRFSFKGKFVTVFVGNIHFAGRTDDEYRIQCPGDLPATLGNSKLGGDTVLILGFSAEVQVFNAWDPDKFLARNSRVRRFSVYTRFSRMQEATAQGFSTHTDTAKQIVSNGLALCALHHRSFDTGLLYVRDDYSIHMNSNRVRHLRKMGRSDGLKSYKRKLRRELFLPAESACLPSPENLTLGNTLRGVELT